jgi:Flp pilus assembly protein CpaB
VETTTRKRPTVPKLSGLPASRGGALALALVCALAAAGVIIYAVGQYRKSVNTSSKQATVLVSSSLIQKYTSGTVIGNEGAVRPEPVLQKQLAPGAVTSAAQLQGMVAARDIPAGTQLNMSYFEPSGGYATQLAPNERAISIPLDASHGLASVLHAGDHVDLYAGLKGNSNSTSSGSTTAGSSTTSTSVGERLLLSNVPVIAVQLNSGSSGVSGGGVGATADVLLKVNATDVGAVALASDIGNIWLVLRGANAVTPKTQSGVVFSVSRVFQGTGGGTP